MPASSGVNQSVSPGDSQYSAPANNTPPIVTPPN